MSRLALAAALVTIVSTLSAPAAFAEVGAKADVTGSLPGQRVVTRARPVAAATAAAAAPAPKRCSGIQCIRMFGSLGVGY